MSKTSERLRYSIDVATPHDLDMIGRYGVRRKFAAPDRNPDGGLNFERIVRAEESTRPAAQLQVELSPGITCQMGIYEFDHSGKVNHPEAIRRRLGDLGTNGLLAVSRMGGRFLPLLDESAAGKYCHPAVMARNMQTGAVEAAHIFAIPKQTEYAGDDIDAINKARRFTDTVYQLQNFFPSDMSFLTEQQQVFDVPRLKGVDIEYDYTAPGDSDRPGITDGDVEIFASQPVQMIGAGVVADAPKNSLVMVHWEVLIESLRLGLPVDDAAKMVFPVGINRLPNGQQGSCFTALGYYSPTTLRRILYQVKT